ncbi:MAG TPA: GIY-YIG nuclease [Alphaproteobacteria bacterium]|nr:GIY-YIG nuclease [Alphaproteobacteria bacterium]
MQNSYVYILSNKNDNVLYIGVTSNIVKRVYEHKNKLVEGFTEKYNIEKLVYYEIFDDIELAIEREKQLKNWHKDWKRNLITSFNEEWKGLYNEISKL